MRKATIGLLTLSGFVFVAVTGVIFNSSTAGAQGQGQAKGQGSDPVHIVAPLPLPVTVTGSAGTVNAAQSGTWTVGINGIALVKNVDERGRMPYQEAGSFIPSECSFNSVLYFCRSSFSAVPAGKRLIIEHVTLFVAVNGGSPDLLRFLDRNNGTAFTIQPTFTPRVGNANHSFLDRPVLVYYEASDIPVLSLQLTAPLSAAQVTVHGYLIDAQ